VLCGDQVDRALREQDRTGAPFGAVCERLFGTDPKDIEQAWAAQYATITQTVQLADAAPDPAALACLTRRQAWQFGALPLRWDQGDLIAATTPDLLVRAHRFIARVVSGPVVFVMAERDDLHAALARAYPLPGGILPSDDRPLGRTAA